MYNNFTNPNYTTGEAWVATSMDVVYYTGKGIATYALGNQVGKLAVACGMFAGEFVLGATSSLLGAFIVGGVVAVLVGWAGAKVICYLGEKADAFWEKIKKQIFE